MYSVSMEMCWEVLPTVGRMYHHYICDGASLPMQYIAHLSKYQWNTTDSLF